MSRIPSGGMITCAKIVWMSVFLLLMVPFQPRHKTWLLTDPSSMLNPIKILRRKYALRKLSEMGIKCIFVVHSIWRK